LQAARPSLRPSLELSEAVGHHGKSAHRGAAEHTEGWGPRFAGTDGAEIGSFVRDPALSVS